MLPLQTDLFMPQRNSIAGDLHILSIDEDDGSPILLGEIAGGKILIRLDNGALGKLANGALSDVAKKKLAKKLPVVREAALALLNAGHWVGEEDRIEVVVTALDL